MNTLRLKLYILLLCCLSISSAKASVNETDYILCVNSYTDASDWSKRIIQTLANEVIYEPDISLAVEHMRSLLIDSEEEYEAYRSDLLTKYDEHPPKLLVLLGNPAFSMRDDFREQWGDIPVILYSGLDYVAMTKYDAKSQATPIDQRVPYIELQDEYNMTLLQARPFVAENIANITKRHPKIETLIFVRGFRQVNIEWEDKVRHILTESYPEVRLKVITPSDFNTGELIGYLNAIDQEKTAVLFSSWCFVEHIGLSKAIVSDANLLIGTTETPMYTLNFSDIITDNGIMHSGVTFDGKELREQFVSTLHTVMSGVQPRDIDFYVTKNPRTYVNYKVAKNLNVDLSKLDKDVILLNEPMTFLEEYASWIITALLFIFITTMFFYRLNLFKHKTKAAEAMKLKAEESNRLKSAFLANMSHEIRTPLNSIIGFTELLIDERVEKEEKEEYADIIKKNNEILLQLIEDILDLSKLEAGVVEVNPTKFDIIEIMNNTHHYWVRRFADKSIKFEVNTPCKFCQVYLDEKIILQMLTNFISNAYKYTAKGEVTLTLDIENNGVKISVKDTGIGISAENQKLIFERFAKLDEFAQGTGLGLSICKALANNCGSEIGFTSTEGVGSTFWAWFPTEVAVSIIPGMVVEDSSNEPLNEGVPQLNRRKRVLVAEDNLSNFKLVEAILKKKYELVRAENGEVAISLFSQEVFDIILMDMQMPVMDGLTAIRKIRESNKTVPIIMVTANVFETDKDAAFDAGCNEFLPRPFNKERLIGDIERLTQEN